MSQVPQVGKFYHRRYITERLELVLIGENLVFRSENGFYHTTPLDVMSDKDRGPYYFEVMS